MNFFHHKDLGNHLLQLCTKVVKHPVQIKEYITMHGPLNVKSLKLVAAKSVPTYRTQRVLLEVVHDRTGTDLTKLVGKAAVLRYEKQMVIQGYS